MKMKYSLLEKSTQHVKIIEAKTEADAFDIACERFGINGFSEFKRHYDGENSMEHKMSFLKRAISNVPKHIHKGQRKGFNKMG